MTMRVARCSEWALTLFANAARYMAENEHLRIVGLGHGDRALTVGDLAGLEIQQHLAMKLRAPFCRAQ